MTSEYFLELLGQINDCYVEEAAPVKQKSRKTWIAVAAAAACAALAIAIPVTLRSLQARTPVTDPQIRDHPPAPTSEQIDVASPTAATNEIEPPAPTLAFLQQYGAFGDVARTVALSDAQVARLKEQEDLVSLADYPTLVNLYPSDQGGLLVALPPDIREQETAVGQDFLAYYYSAAPTDFDFYSMENIAEHVVWYKNDEIDGGVNLDWVQFQLSAPYEGEMTAEAIAAQPIVKAALEWKSIQAPESCEIVELNAKGDPSEFIFTFYEHSNDPVEQELNASFRAVTVEIYMENRLFSIRIDYSDPIILEEVGTTSVTREQLTAFLTKAFPDNPPTEYMVEVFYSPFVETGKYIPCYRVYLLEPDLPRVAGRTVFSVIEVTTADIVSAA